jgi:hypothetical protein
VPKSDAKRFRSEAEECHQKAARAYSRLDKEAWLLLAADCLRLAEEAEEAERADQLLGD